jgi:hypothetical protein
MCSMWFGLAVLVETVSKSRGCCLQTSSSSAMVHGAPNIFMSLSDTICKGSSWYILGSQLSSTVCVHMTDWEEKDTMQEHDVSQVCEGCSYNIFTG